MPTYEYACRDCGEHVEVVQSFRDEPLTECGICGGALRKVFSAAGIIFKGDGYYVTDTRKKAKAAADRGSKKSTSDGGTKTSASDAATKDSSAATSGSSDSGTSAKSA